LRAKGHAVTIFEAAAIAGGVLALSVPDYRLPPSVLEQDVAIIRGLGVEIRTGVPLSPAAVRALLSDGYDAVLVAVGLPEPKRITIPGSALHNVLWGLEFLRAVKSGARPEPASSPTS
jgi:NADH-quinone oxidoreductase subunit F